MAIKLTKTDEKGVTTEYHNIVNFSVFDNIINVVIQNYVNKEIFKSEENIPNKFYTQEAITLPYNGKDKICFDCIHKRLLKTEAYRDGEIV